MSSPGVETSVLLNLPGAVSADAPDSGVASHYGSLFGEQRVLATGEGFVDLSNREIVRITGPDRLTWLHNLTTQYFLDLEAGVPTTALILSPQGHVEHFFSGVDDGESFTAWTEPGCSAALIEFLERMKFMTRVEISLVPDLALAWRPARGYEYVPRDRLSAYAEAAGPAAGLWAFDALRIERGEPRFGIDTDFRSIPNELGWLGVAVHLDKGCYRGQETVARVHTLGRPPRRLTLLHLDGSDPRLPAAGTPVFLADREIGRVGSTARHHELGPIALALIKRNVALDAALVVPLPGDPDGMAAAQEVIVDPEVGLHIRPRLH